MDQQEKNLMNHLIFTREKIDSQRVEINMLQNLIVDLLSSGDEDKKMEIYGDLHHRSQCPEDVSKAFDDRIEVYTYLLKQMIRSKN